MITKEHAYQLRQLIEQLSISLNDETALDNIELFPKWEIDKLYEIDMRVKHNNVLYKCIQAHTSQADWAPDMVPALWAPVSLEEWPEWVQPTGAHDAYKINDKVSHNEKHWNSNVNDNVWEPGIYGWDEV